MEQLRPLTGNSFEFFGLFLFILNLCIPVNEKHRKFLDWDHIVSSNGADMSLNMESLGLFLILFVYINVMSSC